MPESNANESRYGIYFAPAPETPLHRLGSQWLGRDAFTGASLDPALLDFIEPRVWLGVTESPRRYGFHATLKPPFRLAPGATLEDLKAALRAFAEKRQSFQAPAPTVSALGHFLALTLSETSDRFSNLAADCVSEFDSFRAQPTQQELAQRMQPSMSRRELDHVVRWGYPYVFDTWKFHMSLTGSLTPSSIPPLQEHLADRFAKICQQPFDVDSICLFHEPSPGSLFHVVDRVFLKA